MAMVRCPMCGERYSDTYRNCPFCEEEDALLEGDEIRRKPSHSQQFNLVTVGLIVLILLMSGLLLYLLYGDQWGGKGSSSNDLTSETLEDGVMPEIGSDSTGTEDDSQSDMQQETEDPDPVEDEEPDQLDYETAMALPDGLSLTTTDFTLSKVGETADIKASGGSSAYTWISEDPGIASVDNNGTVTAISRGTIQVVATDGVRKGVCIVRVKADGVPDSSDASAGTTTASGLKTGAAVVVNGGNGVRVRSGPGTSYDVQASISNGSSVTIVESAGNDWYKITYSGSNGKATTGYMKGEFLANT